MSDDAPWTWSEDRVRALVGRVRAGRGLTPAAWPGGARCAVALSFDADHETLTLRRGDVAPGRLSQGEYGARRGVPRILDLLAAHDVPATFFIPAISAALHPDEPRRVLEAGHEIGLHSWIHEFNAALPAETERELAFRAMDRLEAASGRRPAGIRTPAWDFSDATLSITRELGLIYDSSLMGDDEPYEILEDGAPTGVVELPVEWIRDDAPYWPMDFARGLAPHTPPSAVQEVFTREFDGAYAEGGLFLLTMHPHLIGHRSRIQVLEGLLRHIRGHDGVWFATHEAVARLCLAEAGMPGGAAPAG